MTLKTQKPPIDLTFFGKKFVEKIQNYFQIFLTQFLDVCQKNKTKQNKQTNKQTNKQKTADIFMSLANYIKNKTKQNKTKQKTRTTTTTTTNKQKKT